MSLIVDKTNYGLIKEEDFIINLCNKGYTENWPREIFIIDYILKNDPWTQKLKDLNREKIIGSFSEKDLLRGKL